MISYEFPIVPRVGIEAEFLEGGFGMRGVYPNNGGYTPMKLSKKPRPGFGKKRRFSIASNTKNAIPDQSAKPLKKMVNRNWFTLSMRYTPNSKVNP